MGYVESNLMKNEDIIYKASIHWFIFVPGAALFLLAIYLFNQGEASSFTAGLVIIIISLYSLGSASITRSTTELAITSKRIIAKTGLIRRKTIELNHGKVESFNIDQSIFGRIFGYGTLVINGTGGGRTPIPSIDNPLDFRRSAMETIDGL